MSNGIENPNNNNNDNNDNNNNNNSEVTSSSCKYAQSIARLRAKFERQLAPKMIKTMKRENDVPHNDQNDTEDVDEDCEEASNEECLVEAFHPIDIERVRRDDWQIERFLRRYDADESVAYDAMIRALRWKKSYGVHDRDDHYFPAEFWQMCNAEICGSDRAGRIVHWGTIKNLRHLPELREMLKQFTAHILEKLDAAAGATGYVIVIDNTGGGIGNINLDLSKFTLATLEHYPESLRSVYSVDLPWLLNSIIKFVMNFAPKSVQRLIHFVDRIELRQHIDPKHIPDYLGGDRVERRFPARAEPLYRCADRLRLEPKFVQHFYKFMRLQLQLPADQRSIDQDSGKESGPKSESLSTSTSSSASFTESTASSSPSADFVIVD